MLTISEKATELIITEESSDQHYYETVSPRCGFEWPEGASGPTVGVGYDCGYCTPNEIQADWEGLIPQPAIESLKRASGKTHENAHQWVCMHRHDVNITWEVAVQQFVQRECPKWIQRTVDALPNCDLLAPDCLGALVSISYNRGAGWRSQLDRAREMRAIYLHMVNKEFDKIPHEILAMRRLWRQGGDLWRRRGHEAELFAAGLEVQPTLDQTIANAVVS